ncbi:MAG TPA: zinc ribbon domain-containing protein [Spirochaetota bacterium]|mgnify:CR=1 FL=1|jgi:putative FmdB family regulatory protein|nr:zinc ribbon domain-containing protein [Spirochaetota bacterium]OPZ38465.1 MAG: Zinc ribbon domain protein [Spirochaetes bacterium ADurb.BinA120]HNU90992.1 zinc ribbon domain-containing protein [Spirochaetota bacterium]HPI15305.1 zinc ribbon domain-containing protein [Spirochaetota bacterium]HPO44579.1 zinc ribbon domain-containing protein [Spirochaetota bacterium]
MPTYEYECMECAHRFELFQSIKDEPVKKCVKCGSEVKRLIGSGAGIIFKGSGFYVNDYKKGGAPCASSSDGGASASGSSCDSCAKSDACS